MKIVRKPKIGKPQAGGNAARNDLPVGCGPQSAQGGATASPVPKERLAGPKSAPPALLAFLENVSVTDAADALGMSRKQAHRVRHGYWPADSRKIMAAWVAYQGRSAALASSWFLRRVQSGALVRQGGHVYSGPRLDEHVGELLALARTAGGGLVAQTLGGQSSLVVLERLEALP